MPFSEQTLHFLTENLLHDSKIWYQEHRAEYQKLVLEPMMALTEQLLPTVIQIDPEIFTTPRRCISRIYRDTRFTKDKSLFRDTVWCSFFRDKNKYDCLPGFFFEFSPAGFRYGCGYYYLPPKQMQLLRDMILAKDPLFLTALEAYRAQDTFSLTGDKYKRPRYAEYGKELQDWLERKDLGFIKESRDFDLLFSDDLAKVLQEGFLTLAPMYRFLCRAAELVGPPDLL